MLIYDLNYTTVRGGMFTDVGTTSQDFVNFKIYGRAENYITAMSGNKNEYYNIRVDRLYFRDAKLQLRKGSNLTKDEIIATLSNINFKAAYLEFRESHKEVKCKYNEFLVNIFPQGLCGIYDG